MTGVSRMSECFCGEFDRPTVAPDEFGETCFHDLDKCEVPPRRVPDDAVIRVLRQKVTRLTALLKAADDVVASQDRRIARALDLMNGRANSSPGYPLLERVLRGESDE